MTTSYKEWSSDALNISDIALVYNVVNIEFKRERNLVNIPAMVTGQTYCHAYCTEYNTRPFVCKIALLLIDFLLAWTQRTFEVFLKRAFCSRDIIASKIFQVPCVHSSTSRKCQYMICGVDNGDLFKPNSFAKILLLLRRFRLNGNNKL